MWISTANKFAKFHAKKLNQSENIPKGIVGYFFETLCRRPVLGAEGSCSRPESLGNGSPQQVHGQSLVGDLEKGKHFV